MGKKDFVQLWRTQCNLTMNPTKGVQPYHRRQVKLDDYLQFALWEVGDKAGKDRKSFTKMEKRENLENGLMKIQTKKLIELGWSIYEEQYIDTINKLELMEPLLSESN